jgi:hypothetical protein
LCLIVDDDNQDGAAIMLFKHFDFSKIPGRDAAEPLSPGVDKGKSVPTAE